MSILITILLLLFAVVSVVILANATRRRDGMIQYPFLAAAVMLGWVFPQLVGLSLNQTVSYGAAAKSTIFTLLCLLAGTYGYTKNLRPAKMFNWELSLSRLHFAAAFLSAAGAYFFLKVSSLAAEAIDLYGGAWTGIITIYVFLSSMLTVGMVMAVVAQIHRSSLVGLSIILFDLAFYFDRIVIQGRRTAMVEVFAIALFFVWARRQWLPPRSLIFGAICFGALVVNSIGDYRAIMLTTEGNNFGWSGAGAGDIAQIDFLGNFLRNVRDPSPYANQEILNATLTIEAEERAPSFDFGLSIWNAFVVTYVPAQLVGVELKQDLLIPFGDIVFAEFDHVRYEGTTSTGMSDSFRSFWYFGAIKFALIGLIMSRWYRAAMRGNPVAQMIIMLITPLALLGITHTTHQFFLGFVSLALFLLPAVYFSRRPVGPRRATTFDPRNRSPRLIS